MKKTLLTIALCFGLALTAHAAPFNSNQTGGGTPTSGFVLQSAGANTPALWVSTTTLGFSGGGSGSITYIGASTTIPALSFSGVPISSVGTTTLNLTTGFTIPLTASTTEWAKAYASTTALTNGFIRALFSNSITGETYTNTTGVTSQTAGYSIPLTASTTQWASLVNASTTLPYVTSITASSPLTGGVITTSGSIGCQTASAAQAGCIAAVDWSRIPLTASTTQWANLVNSSTTLPYVTSVALTTPTGLSISGSPITSAGTLALSFTAGYAIPLTASTTQWANFFNSPCTFLTAGTNITCTGTSTINSTASGGSGNSAFTLGNGFIFNATTSNMVGIGSSSPIAVLSIQGSSTFPVRDLLDIASSTGVSTVTFGPTGNYFRFGGKPNFNCSETVCLEVGGSDNSTSGTGINTFNTNSGTAAYTGYTLSNDKADTNVTNYAGMWLNSSTYTDTTFGVLNAVPYLQAIQNSMGPIMIDVATTTAASSYINFGTGGSAAANERMRITSTGTVGIGTTTPAASQVQIQKDQNAATELMIRNDSTGGSSRSGITLNMGSTGGTTLDNFGTSYTPTGLDDKADSGRMLAQGVGGFSIRASDAAGTVKLFTGPALRLTLDTNAHNGHFGVGSSTPAAVLSVQGTTTDPTADVFDVASSTGKNLFGVQETGAVTIGGSAGSSGQLLASGGVGAPPTWTTSTAGKPQLPTYIVAASGGDFTTIQGALDAAGTAGGGTIFLTNTTYAQAGTGLTFKGSNTNIYCRTASTTITFTGATTGFKTNSAAGQYSHNGIHGCTITGDANASGVAINISDMSHSEYDHLIISSFARAFKVDDTQNVTFYNHISDNDITTLSVVGFDASSTNPFNGNVIERNFIGCSSNNCVGIQLTNGNGNAIRDNYIEPDGTKTGVVDIKLFDINNAACNGIFNNTIEGNYLEGGVVSGTIGFSLTDNKCVGTPISRNYIANNTNENHTTDWSVTTNEVNQNTWVNNYDSNFGDPLTSFQGPFSIGTSTEMNSIGTSANYLFAIQASTSAPTRDIFLAASSSYANLFRIDFQGSLVTGGSAPTVSTCGTTPNGSLASGNDNSGTVTVGGGVVTACTVTFKAPKSSTPRVFVETEGATAIASTVSAKSTTAFTVTFAATLGGGTFDYWVVQ